jgi:glycosyltransferase involved in cell wall biosynthesis
MKILPKCSLIISTYNWPEALSVCLKSLLKQTIKPNEIIIADDGSKDETKQLIESFKINCPIPIKHVWQPDEGFKLSEIRNKALAVAAFDYIIQIDGDLYLDKNFVKDHLNFAKLNSFVRASRIYLDQSTSIKLLNNELKSVSYLDKGVSNKFSAIRFPYLWRFFEYNYKMKGDELYEIHGCNMAYWRADAIKVNGYNEEFLGWGPEDKEFITRLLNIGIKKRFLKLGGIVYHIWHKENSKKTLENNMKIFKLAIQNKTAFCERGINQYI